MTASKTNITIVIILCLKLSYELVIPFLCLNLNYNFISKISFQSRLCDRRDSLVIDSAIAYPTSNGMKVLLFSGHVFYESELINNTNDRMNFTSKPIKELNETLEPPIDIAFKPMYSKYILLYNVN